jgi:hypothetical protein
LDLVPRAWKPLVVDEEGKVDRRAYTMCFLERLQDALQRRDVFVPTADRWADPRRRLLKGAAWKAVRAQVCRTLDLDPDPERELDTLAKMLDDAYRRTDANFPQNAAVSIEDRNGEETLILTPLDNLEESASLLELRERVDALMPRVDLPDVLLEIQAHTGFVSEFTHISETGSRAADMELSLCAVLIAEACNVGLEPLVRLP